MTPEQRLSYISNGWKPEVELIESWRLRADTAYSAWYAVGLRDAAMDLEALLVNKLVAQNRYES